MIRKPLNTHLSPFHAIDAAIDIFTADIVENNRFIKNNYSPPSTIRKKLRNKRLPEGVSTDSG